MSSTIPLKQFEVSYTHDDGLSPRPPITSAVDSPPSRRPTVADHHGWNPLLKASQLGPVSSSFITCVPSSCKSPVRAIAARRTAVPPSSAVGSQAELHHCSRLVMEKPPVRPEIDIGAPAAASPPAAVVLEPPLTELTRSTVNPPLTELTRSTQLTQPFQQPASSIPTPILPKKSFAEVVAPPQASKTAKSAHHKYFPTDSPPAAFGTVLTGDNGPTLQFTDAETEILAAPFRFALVGKFSHGAPSYSMLHKLMAGTGIKNRFTVSMLNNRRVLISLSCESDYTRLWLRRIWYIQGYPMRVFKWTPTFTPSQESSIVPGWVSFPELPAYLFRKEVLFTVASMIGTPLRIDDATLNQSKLSKARACIELDLLKPRLEDFQIQICGTTIVQRIEYEDIPNFCSLCKHVGHRDSECYSKGDAPKPPPRKQRKRAAVEVERGKAVVQEVGESSKTREQPEQLQPAKDTRYHAEHQTETMTSVNEFSVPADEVHNPCEAGKMGDLPADNLVVSSVENIVETNLPNLVVGVVYPPIGGVEIQMRKKRVTLPQASKLFKNLKLFGMISPPLEEWDETDESEGEDDDVNLGSPRPLKIQDPVCSLNSNSADIEERE
ncbi:UNVERIFIED_CONTAM: hypothetical protein Sindi_1940100 [Sesamum indicum]